MYSELIDQKINEVHQKGVATKILQSLDRIRNEFDPLQARRWPTELLQNARDLAYPDMPVRVQIELSDDAVYFRHSGKPFSVKDILSIVNQVSSKKPGEGVGQFGTGFMSTFQLSMKVDVRSFLKDQGEPYRPFSVCLDRSGATHEEITAAIFAAMESLKQADQAAPLPELDRNAFNTEFHYHLNDVQSRTIARTGMEDLRNTLAVTMLFSQQLGEAELLYTGGQQERILFRRGAREVLDGGLERQDILVGGETRSFFLFSRDGLSLAAEWDQERGFLPVDAGMPRLFIDFPLVGSEQFPFPGVINSLSLRPNEPRSGISLVEHAQSLDGEVNRTLIDQAVVLYENFFAALLDFDLRGAEHLVAIPAQQDNKEWSESWIRGHIYNCLYTFLAQQKLLPVGGTRHALAEPELYLVRSGKPETRRELAALCGQICDVLAPEDEVDWYAAFSGYRPEKTVTLMGVLERAPKIIAHGLREGAAPVEWLTRLYDLGMESSAAATAIRAGNIAVFPSQNEADLSKGTLYTAKELYSDPGIPDVLKDAAEQLDGLESDGKLEIRRKLLHAQFLPRTAAPLSPYPVSSFCDYVTTRCDRDFPVKNFIWYGDSYEKMWAEAWKLLLASGPDGDMYQLAMQGWKDLPDRQDCSGDGLDTRMWSCAYRNVLRELLQQVRSSGRLEALERVLARRDSQTDAIQWLEALYGKTVQYLRASDWFFTDIIPNQDGKFCSPSELKLDGMDDEELKSIALCFREEYPKCGLSVRLADRRLKLPGWNLSVMSLEEGAGYLNSALVQFFSGSSLPQAPLELQEACTRLLGWIREHPEQAKRCFPGFCKEEDQMKLLTPRAAVSLRRKADRFDKLLALAGVGSEEELEEILNAKKAQGGGSFDAGSGMWLDGDWLDMDENDRDERLRRIGTAGEKCAFRAVVEHLSGCGYTVTEQEGDHIAVLTAADGGGQAVVERPDTADYHQSGWDIRVALTEGEETRIFYLEVKTHTPGSVVRSLLPLSNTQMQMAAAEGERYILLKVIYDEAQDRAVSMDAFSNVPALLGQGVLFNTEGRYLLAGSTPGLYAAS